MGVWKKFMHNQHDKNLLFQQYYQLLFTDNKMMYVGSLLERAARLYPHNDALVWQDRTISYHVLHQKVMAVSKQLQTLGVKQQDIVILLFENSLEFYIGYYAIWQIGAVAAPLNTFLHEKELFYIIQDAAPKAMIISDRFAQRLSNFNESTYTLPPMITESEIKELTENYIPGSYVSVPYIDPDQMAALLYTSGTTGFPKGVMLSSRNILTNIVQGLCLVQTSINDKILAALPLFHSFAQGSCVWGSFFVGGTTIVVPRIERRALLEGLAHNPTFILGVPALYGLFCLMKTVPFDYVRYFVCGGDALPDKIRIAFESIYRRRLCNGYGLTETSPLVAINFDDELLQANTVGYVAPRLAYRLCDEQEKEVAPGQKGILWVKGDNVMLGYYNAPDATAEVIKDGWFNTGDWAFADLQGRLIISGRHKDVIAHKGFKIYPQEIENILLSHRAIMQAAVVGQKDEDVGEIPVAFVVLKEGEQVQEESLKTLCKEHLASYKIPRQFFIITAEQLPVTPLKKIDKKKLRLLLSEGKFK